MEQLKVFLRIVASGSIQGADCTLGATRSSLSRMLEELEGQTGAPVLNRDPEGLRLTAAGAVLFEQGGALLDASLALADGFLLSARHLHRVRSVALVNAIWSGVAVLALAIAVPASAQDAKDPRRAQRQGVSAPPTTTAPLAPRAQAAATTIASAPEASAGPASAAAPATKPRLRLLVLDLRAQSVDKATAELLTSAVGVVASRHPSVTVLTSADLRQLISVEEDKQIAGCADQSESCMAEVASALGAEFVVYGDVGRLGDATTVTLNLVDTTASKPLARELLRATSLEVMPELMHDAFNRMLLPVTSVAMPPMSNADRRIAGVADGFLGAKVGGAGALALVVGGAAAVAGFAQRLLYFNTRPEVADFRDAPLDDGRLGELATQAHEAEGYRTAWNTWGNKLAPVGVAVAGVGVAAIAAGIVLSFPSTGGIAVTE